MSADKYPTIFSCQMATIVYLSIKRISWVLTSKWSVYYSLIEMCAPRQHFSRRQYRWNVCSKCGESYHANNHPNSSINTSQQRSGWSISIPNVEIKKKNYKNNNNDCKSSTCGANLWHSKNPNPMFLSSLYLVTRFNECMSLFPSSVT